MYERVRYARFMNIYNLFYAQYKLQNGSLVALEKGLKALHFLTIWVLNHIEYDDSIKHISLRFAQL